MGGKSVNEFRATFLKLFVQQLIKSSYAGASEKNSATTEEIVQEEKVFGKNEERKNISTQKNFLPSTIRKENHEDKIPPALISRQPTLPTQNVSQEKINLGKVTQFLLDPTVLSVECPGPNRNILVNRSGIMQTSGTSLTKEEIDNLLKEISNKTRIPIVEGLFKTAFQDLVLTAVVSNFVGSRFVIQKINPLIKPI